VRTIRNTQIHRVDSPYLTGNTLPLHYRDQPVNAVWGNSRCLLWDPYGTHIHCLGTSVRPSQETHYVSSTESTRSMLFEETVAVYCETRTEHTDTLRGYFSSYLIGNTLRLLYREHPVNAVRGNSRCLLWDPYGTHRYTERLLQLVPHRKHITSLLQSPTGHCCLGLCWQPVPYR
jgi:hypothetical protein